MSVDMRVAGWMAVIALLTLGGCAAPRSQVRVDQADFDLTRCRSFAWLPASSDAASLTEQRVRAAVLQQLEAKGYTLEAERPDCRITYVLAVSELPRAKPSVGVGAGGGSGGVGGGIGVSLPVGSRDRFSGTFTLDVVDVAANAQVWSGSLDASFRDRELGEEEVSEVVQEVLAAYPDRGAPPRVRE